VWDLVKAERDGDILLEVSRLGPRVADRVDGAATNWSTPSNRSMPTRLADLAPDLPTEVIRTYCAGSSTPEEREQLRAAMSYPENSVGALMDFDMVTVREDVTLESCCAICACSTNCPTTPTRFSSSTATRSCGARCRWTAADQRARSPGDGRHADRRAVLQVLDSRRKAAQAFERYDLVSAPVIDPRTTN
jgi:magnesium transporter